LARTKADRKANIQELDDIDDILKESTMLEQTIERWFEDATLKGIRQGRNEGIATIVTLQLQQRFGSVPMWAQDRLNTASAEQLTRWAGVILTAKSMEDLFGTDGPMH